MAGRIRDEDIAEVREKTRIDDVISAYVTLRSAGGGSLKGLCPFHDEKTPSFNVNPSRGFYHCLAGETQVLTYEGPLPIRDLAGGVHRILNRHGDWVEAPFKSYGVQPLMKITLGRTGTGTGTGQVKEIFATDEHRWFVMSAGPDESVLERWTKALRPGDRLASTNVRELAATASRHGVALADRPAEPLEDWEVLGVQPTDRVEEVYCAEVEDGHAFTLEDNILTGNCFGCGEGGDAIAFLMKLEGTTFVETVERLAEKCGIQLRYEEGGPQRREGGPPRARLIEAHKVAQAFYAEQLATPAAAPARQFLAERGFDQAAAEHFGVGFSPQGGEVLARHLKARSFTDEEVTVGGLVGNSGRGPYDRFRGRLMWPIRETNGDTIGFGARRILEDDRIDAKYLNTIETPIYKKSHVLYGIDLARRDIARSSRAVVVEGYTDVMACHLAGVTQAVATCGTAFGDDHARVVRRLLHDHEEFRGEVIFTFDGDEAGQKAAIKAFEGDQQFVSQTYVAVEPDGLDPWDVRMQKGDAEVRELVARRVPLYRFVLGNIVRRYDLDRADGRIDALRAGAALVGSVRDKSKVDAFARELAGMVGIEPDDARREVRRVAARTGPPQQRTGSSQGDHRWSSPTSASEEDVETTRRQGPPALPAPDPRDPRLVLERETLKLVVQHPQHTVAPTRDLHGTDFTHPAYRALWEAVLALGGPVAATSQWASDIAASCTDPTVRGLVSVVAVEPVNARQAPDSAYAAGHVYRLQELTAQRRIAEIKSRLQRTNPVDAAAEYNKMFGELVALEQHRRHLRDLAVGEA